jgi:hypothetical protein
MKIRLTFASRRARKNAHFGLAGQNPGLVRASWLGGSLALPMADADPWQAV